MHHHFEQVNNEPEFTTYYTGLRTACAYVENRYVDRIEYGEFEFKVGLTARVIRVEISRVIVFGLKIGIRIRFLGGQLVLNLLSNYDNNEPGNISTRITRAVNPTSNSDSPYSILSTHLFST